MIVYKQHESIPRHGSYLGKEMKGKHGKHSPGFGLLAINQMFKLQCRDPHLVDGRSCLLSGYLSPNWTRPLQRTNPSAVPPLPSSRFHALDGPFAPTPLKKTMGAFVSKPQKPLPQRLKTASTCM